jgi:predicted DNA-binding transcriptional regulator AlpA
MGAHVPFWPRMMKRATACAYLDLSVPELEREITAGRLPHPVKLGNVLHWSRAEIDTYLERLTGEANIADDWRKGTKLYGNG